MAKLLGSSQARRAWFAIALLAILVRAFVPVGYMTAGERGPGFVICSGQSAPAGARTDHSPAQDTQKTGSACPFAVMQGALPSPDAPLLATPTLAPSPSAPRPLASLSPGRGLAAPPPPSTGPPPTL